MRETAIRNKLPASVATISRSTNIPESTVYRLLNRMIKKGLITKEGLLYQATGAVPTTQELEKHLDILELEFYPVFVPQTPLEFMEEGDNKRIIYTWLKLITERRRD